MAGFASIVLGLSIFLLPGIVVAADFVGSDECQRCHEENYRDWSASGHPYKLMKSEEARHRPIPLPLGTTWDDVSYVIGGYKWKSRYIDTEGYIITVTEDEDGNELPGGNQYDYLTGEWVDYHPGEVRPYNCGSCHTTNWVADEDHDTDNDLTDNQDGLPGMHGTFDAGGIHCEQCHGNGLGFPSGGEGMQVDDSAEMCGNCHFRDFPPGGEENGIPASGGFIKHHEQYNEHLAGPHAEKKCVDCHNPHKRGEFSIWQDGDSEDYPGAQCGVNCHSDKQTSFDASHSMAGYGVECKDCHMPYATKSANKLGPFEGDLQTHIFYINTDAEANMFTEDGTLVVLDDEGKAAVTLDFACKRCHETADMAELGRHAKNFHGDDTSVSQLEYVGINPGLTGNWWGGHDRDGEGFLLEVAESSGALTLIVSFYTYDDEGNQVYLIAAGPATTGMTSAVNVYITEGRMWGAAFDPTDGATTQWGTGTFEFPACDVGTFSLTPNATYVAEGFTDLTYNLSRDITVSKIACPTFSNAAE
jgi:hypothetical protein